jgi:RimJ/RimL family protein N-acetyltransferase/8-oxo-dGTP pyrophosphatase MutT (NUDIX family)
VVGGSTAPPPQPTMSDGEVTLRPWTFDDVEDARLQHDEELAYWFGFPEVVPTADRQRAAIRRWHEAYAAGRSTVNFLVEHQGSVAGTVEVRQLGDRKGELSWAVFADHRGRGLGTRAVRLLIDYCFTELSLQRVSARVEVGNLASLRTAARAGLRREGVARSDETTADRRADYVVLARLASDPAPDSPEGFRAVLNAALPTKHVITQGLIRSDTGKLLLCELTYKREWDLPGGIVDPGESPVSALAREVHEELGLVLPNRGLRLASWLPPWRGWDDACLFVFDLGVHPESVTAAVVPEPREIRAVHWCTADEAEQRVAPYLAHLLPCLLDDSAGPTYLEAGTAL